VSGLHADAVAVLSSWTAPDAAQEGLRRAYLAHLERHPDGMWRTCRPAHVTAGTIVLDSQGERTALVLHRRIGLWVQPGGHCEAHDTSLAGVAEREAREETGLAGLTVRPVPVVLSQHRAPCGAELHLDVQYVGTAADDSIPVVSEESHDVRWFPVTALPAALASGVADNIAAAVDALRRG
jgi:8-oxo-dGTP pyrophosphatase MutT (NUDIX family)